MSSEKRSKNIKTKNKTCQCHSCYDKSEQNINKIIKKYLNDIFRDNDDYVDKLHGIPDYLEGQTPRSTVVMCSDSRVQIDAFDKDGVNDVFVIRNIGNQISTSSGSVEYGVEHLKTPLLVIIGHSGCGAVEAAMEGYCDESVDIRKELRTLPIRSNYTHIENIINNINYQVMVGLRKFRDLVEKNELRVIGILYDVNNYYGKGYSNLILVNYNGITDRRELKRIELLKKSKKHLL